MSSAEATRRRLWPLVLCAVLFAAGAVLALTALRGAPPEATPVPDREFSLTREEVLALDPVSANRPIALPAGDLGPYVGTRPVVVPDPIEAGADPVEAGADPGEAESGADPQVLANHLYIPSIFVSAPVVPQGVTSANEMALPENLHQVGLLGTTSELDAQVGSTLLAGHVTAGGDPGALYFLGRVRPGASVTTVDAAGRPTEWAVASVRSYRKTSLPPQIFDSGGERLLTLVTCGGQILQTPDGRWTHEDNIVVTAVPVS